MIKQGHKYNYKGQDVIAMENGAGWVSVAPIHPAQPYQLGAPFLADTKRMQPVAMAYFHGQVPGA